jgi:hypothetical protein
MISFPHKTIFIHIPKCAGQSIEETFLNDIGLDWCKHRHLFGCFKKPSTWSDNFPNRLAHLTAYEYFDLDFVNKEIFSQFYKFSIVRDPLDRIVSAWKDLTKSIDYNKKNINFFILNILPKYINKKNFFFRSQKDFLFDPNTGKILVDNIIKFNELKSGWKKVKKATGIKINLTYRNKSKDIKIDVSENCKQLVKELYKEDYYFLQKINNKNSFSRK